ncbi:MAG: hypothetical protein KAI95_16520 [Bacteroidales bacterium]|nr:hypothetical protein [Bacteroidales bacterium]
MIKINAIALTVIFAFMLIKPAIPFMEYLARKDFIIENFCINRNKKEMKCNGKCHLKEQVRKEATQSSEEKAPFRPQNERNDWSDYLIGQKLTDRPYQFHALLKTYYSLDYTFQYIPSIFHPPM